MAEKHNDRRGNARNRVAPIYAEIGNRLRAYRVGAGLSAEELAERLGVSRAALYRIEAGMVVKIDTLERLATVLQTSVASLLGVGVEYYAKAVAYFERMRQLEAECDQLVAHFEPFSYLLTSEEYGTYLRQMMVESLPRDLPDRAAALKEIDDCLTVLEERKSFARKRRPSIGSFMSVIEIERFLNLGLVGRLDLPAKTRADRIAAARREVERVVALLEEEPMGIQIGVIEDMLPNVTFQIFHTASTTRVAVSPFRLGELPNIRTGIATVTAAEEAVTLYNQLAKELWRRAAKGARAADVIRKVLRRIRN